MVFGKVFVNSGRETLFRWVKTPEEISLNDQFEQPDTKLGQNFIEAVFTGLYTELTNQRTQYSNHDFTTATTTTTTTTTNTTTTHTNKLGGTRDC